MSAKHSSSFLDATKQRFTDALAKAGNGARLGAEAIRDVIAATLQDPRAAGAQLWQSVSDCVGAAVALVQEGGGRMRDAVQGAMLGAMQGTRRHHAMATDVVERVVAALVRDAIVTRDDVGPVVYAAIESAVDAAREAGFSADEAAAAAARGILAAARRRGPQMYREVRAAMPRFVKGVHVPDSIAVTSAIEPVERHAS